MRLTTVASVTEQMIFFRESTKTASTNPIHRYIVIHLTTHPHDPFATLHNNKNLRNAVADANGAAPQKRDFLTKSATNRRIRLLRPRSLHDTLSRSHLHTPYQQQSTKLTSRRIRTSSLVIDFSSFFVSLQRGPWPPLLSHHPSLFFLLRP